MDNFFETMIQMQPQNTTNTHSDRFPTPGSVSNATYHTYNVVQALTVKHARDLPKTEFYIHNVSLSVAN